MEARQQLEEQLDAHADVIEMALGSRQQLEARQQLEQLEARAEIDRQSLEQLEVRVDVQLALSET